MKKQSSKIGLQGELRVAQILTGSEHPNIIKESFLPYDIIWKGIKINVKTTAQTVSSSNGACSFYVKVSERCNGVVLVFAALLEQGEYFWVENPSANIKTYFKIADAMSADELPNKIEEVNRQPTPKITENYAKTKTIQLKPEDFIRLDAVRNKAVERRGFDMSLSQTVMEAVKLLEDKVSSK